MSRLVARPTIVPDHRPDAGIADVFLRWSEPGHVRLYRSPELGAYLQDAGLSHVELRRLSNGGFAIARGIVA